jgi:hypothetical protein
MYNLRLVVASRYVMPGGGGELLPCREHAGRRRFPKLLGLHGRPSAKPALFVNTTNESRYAKYEDANRLSIYYE